MFDLTSDSLIVRAGEKPTIAPGSAKVISARFARLANACPVVGLARTDIRGNLFSENRSAETVIFPICNKESKPS